MTHAQPPRPLAHRLLAFALRRWPAPRARAATFALLRRELGGDIPGPAPTRELRVTVADSAWIERIGELAPTRPREAVHRSRDAGHVCTCALWDGELAGFGWEARDASFLFYGEELESRVLPLGPGEVHTYDLYVVPPFRGRGVATAMKSHQQRRLLEAGEVRSLSLVQCWNVPSLRLQRRADARPDRLVFFYAIGRTRWTSLGRHGDPRLPRWYDAVGNAG